MSRTYSPQSACSVSAEGTSGRSLGRESEVVSHESTRESRSDGRRKRHPRRLNHRAHCEKVEMLTSQHAESTLLSRNVSPVAEKTPAVALRLNGVDLMR